MHSVGSYEAKTHLSSLLARVSRGEKIAITRHGSPVAVLVPAGKAAIGDRQAVVQAIMEFRKANTLQGISVREMIEEGRRF
jgi:prevent-host-death family protein